MIERCINCGKEHETEPDGPQELYGHRYLVCPTCRRMNFA